MSIGNSFTLYDATSYLIHLIIFKETKTDILNQNTVETNYIDPSE